MVSLVVQCVWASLLTLTGTYNDLLDYVIFAVLLFYMLTIAGVFVLRRKRRRQAPTARSAIRVLPALTIAVAAVISSAAAVQAELHLARTDHRAAGGPSLPGVVYKQKGSNHEPVGDQAA